MSMAPELEASHPIASTADQGRDATGAQPEAVDAHAATVVVWDVPSAVEVGGRFRMKVGVKCASECRLADARFGVVDHTGARIAGGTLPAEVWPGTAGLYAREIELQAPAAAGLHEWRVTAPESEGAGAHPAGSVSFGVRVVSRPEHVVTVEAIDGDTGAPLAGARVVLHPYHAVTDERGIATVRVAKGAYRLFVSQTAYATFGLSVEVADDTTARAELSLEPVPERN